MKRDLIVLHGALGNAAQLQFLKPVLEQHFTLYFLDWEGHAKETRLPDQFSIASFSKQLARFIQDNKLEEAGIFAYSMGGYVALNYLSEYPEAKNMVFTLATKFAWTPASSQKESSLLNPEKLEQKVPAYAEILKNRFGESNWKVVLAKTAQLMLDLGQKQDLSPEKLKNVQSKIRLCVGDKDQMVSVEETEFVFKTLTFSSFLVIPDTTHPIEKIDMQRIEYEIVRCFC